jgi:hypothetical protein
MFGRSIDCGKYTFMKNARSASTNISTGINVLLGSHYFDADTFD